MATSSTTTTTTKQPCNFWDIGNYMRIPKRINDSNLFCDDLVKMFTERADIEAKYSKRLQEWHEKWTKLLESSSCVYGFMKLASLGVIKEAQDTSLIHIDACMRLHNLVVENIKQYKDANYHRAAFVGLKETRKYEEEFAKAQKPWAHAFTKVHKAKKDYHAARKQREIASQSHNIAIKDVEVHVDKITKLEAAVNKSERNVAAMKKRYEDKLVQIGKLNAAYETEMKSVYGKWERDEVRRKEFLQRTLLGYHRAVDVLADRRLKECLDNQVAVAHSGRPQYDVEWFSDNFGANMTKPWPKFEEFSRVLASRAPPQRRFTLPLRRKSQPPLFRDTYSTESMTVDFFDREMSRFLADDKKKRNGKAGAGVEETHSKSLELGTPSPIPHQEGGEMIRGSTSSFSLPLVLGYQFSTEKVSFDLAAVKSRSFDSLLTLNNNNNNNNNNGSNNGIVVVSRGNLEHQSSPSSSKVVSKYSELFGLVTEVPMIPLPLEDQPTRLLNDSALQCQQQQFEGIHQQVEVSHNQMNEDPSFERGNDNEWDDIPPPTPVPGGGVPVRALYDYTGVESDELTFKAGDILTKLTEVDHQGWCTGKKDDQEGLYPANYVETI